MADSMVSITDPSNNATFQSYVRKQGEPPLASFNVLGTCTDATHDVKVALFTYPKADGATPVEQVTANGASWTAPFVNIAVGQYRIEAACSNNNGGQDR